MNLMALNNRVRPRRLHPRAVAGGSILGVGLALALSGSLVASTVATAADPNPGSAINLVLSAGADQTARNLAWYTAPTVTEQSVRVAKTSDVKDGQLPDNATVIAARRGTEGLTTSGENNWFAEITNLAEDTSYSYQVGAGDDWSAVSTFRTLKFSGDFDFLFYGDPQIGSSGDEAADTAGWQATLDLSTQTYPDAELLFSAGDQVEKAPNETQYDLYLSPRQLQEIPMVATIGNHDYGSKAYEQHYNIPNNDPTAGAGTDTASGGDYWFVYKGVLFLDINSNSLDDPSHIEWIKKTIADHADGTKWQVLAFHHSIYSYARHSEDDDIQKRRADLPETISETGIDLVLQGHDHSYARSYLINKDGKKADPAEEAGTDILTPGPGGVLYLTANSASGSKYYDHVPGSEANDNFSYLSVGNQEHVPNYTAIEVSDESITLKTLRSTAYEDHPANSVVDQMTLYQQNGIAPRITTPGDVTIALGADFDPTEGVEATDDKDGDVTKDVEVKGSVDTDTVGTYTLQYSVKDSAGNVGSFDRTIHVVPAQQGEVSADAKPVTGTEVTIKASGLTPGATYTVSLGDVELGTVTVDKDGTAVLDAIIPDLPAGDYQVDFSTSDGTVVASTTVTVTAASPSASPSATPSDSTTPSAQPSTPAAKPAGNGNWGNGNLADTGSDLGLPLIIGGAVVAASGAGLLISRRRKH